MSARVEDPAARLTRAERRWLADARHRLARARLVRSARSVPSVRSGREIHKDSR
ncbi:MAG: hypothetical protein L0H31_00165 [Nocardioidaceae bacterium]|nr:hypothetical protein [Nocardioidaceae bacterium]